MIRQLQVIGGLCLSSSTMLSSLARLQRRKPKAFSLNRHHHRRGYPSLATSASPGPHQYRAELPDRTPTEAFKRLASRSVPEAPCALATSPHAFLDHLRSPLTAPFVIRSSPRAPHQHRAVSKADIFLRALRVAGDRLVEVEAGRYDRASARIHTDQRFEVPLSVYLDWLTGEDGPTYPGAGSLQLYLAQWRARDDVRVLSLAMKCSLDEAMRL